MWLRKSKAQPSCLIYELGPVLGQGAHSVVYRAWRKDIGGNHRQEVAIKILKSKKLVGIWRKEFEALSRVVSPYCVRVYGFEWFDDQPALILELVHGVTLSDLLRWVTFTKEDVLALARQMAQGLRDLHKQGLSHGDLSPLNIMVDQEGKARLLDFGLLGFGLQGRRTTVDFAAPEVFCAEELNGPAVDWFALGKILSLLAKAYGCEADFDELIQKLTAEDPTQRQWQEDLLPLETSSLNKMDGEQLAARVRQAQVRHLSWLQATRSLTKMIIGMSYPRPKYFLLSGLVVFGLLSSGASSVSDRLFPFSQRHEVLPSPPSRSSSLRSSFGMVKGGSVEVRSQHWLQLFWNHQEMGYAPVKWTQISPGIYKLSWISAKSRGSFFVTVKAGDQIIFNEEQLLHLSTGF